MSAPLHILLVSSSLNYGGSDTYMGRLARSLVEGGDRVTVAYGRYYRNPLLASLDDRIGRLELPFRSTQASKANHFPNVIGSTAVLTRFCVAQRVSVVHTVLPSVGLAGWLAARASGRPAVHTPMSTSSVAGTLNRALYRFRGTRLILNRYLALSEYLADDLRTRMAVAPEMVQVCRLGIEIGRYRPREHGEAQAVLPGVQAERWVGVCARLEPDKDVERAIRAFALLDPEIRAHLAVVGEGSQREALEELANHLGIGSRVHFLGSRPDVSDIMRQFDVGLQTTRGPNLGMVTLEMLASGVPVVIAARDADEVLMAEDTLVGAGGGLVADAAPEALAAALEQLLAGSAAERGEYRRRARATAETYYDWKHHVAAVRGVYRELAEKQKQPHARPLPAVHG